MLLAYDGTAYHGWQIQSDARTVQGCLVDAAHRVVGDAIRVTGASRTDAGVHALGQVASLMTTSTMTAATLHAALNAVLPIDIRILEVEDAESPFDARRSAYGKRYVYVIDNAVIAQPLTLRYAWHVREPLDLTAMAQALAPLRGRHDFSAFCAAAGRDRDPTCTVRSLRLRRWRQFVMLFVSADGFLHNMVRNIVGSAVDVGRRRRTPEWMQDVLRARDRTKAAATAPPHGLTLLRVLYRDAETQAGRA